MKIGLWSDAVNFPSLPLMKLSAYHKERGDSVKLIDNFFEKFDLAYCSKTFNLPTVKKIPELPCRPNADKVIYGGTGYAIEVENGREVYRSGNDPPLPKEIEHIYPDYSLYPDLTKGTAFGFITRGCPNNCGFCVVTGKEGARSVRVAELSEFHRGQGIIKLMDANLLACREREPVINALIASKARIDFTQGLDARFVDGDTAKLLCRTKIEMVHFAFDLMRNEAAILRGLAAFRKYYTGSDRNRKVYILTNYNTDHAEDWYRVQKVIELGYHPDVRIYQKGTHDTFLTDLARWANNPLLFRSCSFPDYVPRKDGKNCGELYAGILRESGGSGVISEKITRKGNMVKYTKSGGDMTLGSLFDGIGAFPFAASFFGIKAIWASEILQSAVSVTRRHFPGMEHLGDITKLDGGRIPPVDIVTFGSPCQSFSVAAGLARTGFEGKSGLFTEAIRIITEMRCATNGQYPRIAVFENVPGLLNSNKGRDFQIVLEALTKSKIPMPESGKWADAGMVRGGRTDLAWVVRDAQYHRTAQRRRRLFAVVDFTGRRAAEILFVEKSLSGYFEARAKEGKGTSAAAENGARCAAFNGYRSVTAALEYAEERAPCINRNMPPNVAFNVYGETGQGYWREGVQTVRAEGENRPSRPGNVAVGAFMAGQGENARSVAYSETLSPTLRGSPSGLNQIPCVCEPQIVRTLTARGDSSPCVDRGQNIVTVFGESSFGKYAENNVSTLKASGGSNGGGSENIAVELLHIESAVSNCLTPWDTQQARIHMPDGVSPTLAGADGGGGRHPGGLIMTETHPAVAGTLCASGAGLSRPAGNANEPDLCVVYRFNNPVRMNCVIRRLTPTECERLMAFPDGWTEYGHDGKPISDSARYQLCGNSIVVNCLAPIMQNIGTVLSRGIEALRQSAKE
jgi:DNA (cytosine-5)-methyltransferase 1